MLRSAARQLRHSASQGLWLSSRGVAGVAEPAAAPTVCWGICPATDACCRSTAALAFCSAPVFPQATVKLLIDGKFVESKTKDWIDVKNPATQASHRRERKRRLPCGWQVVAAIANQLGALRINKACSAFCIVLISQAPAKACASASCEPNVPPTCFSLSHSFITEFPPSCIPQEVVSRLPLCTAGEFNAAVQSSKDAFPKWRNTPVPQRARVMLKLQVWGRKAHCGCLVGTIAPAAASCDLSSRLVWHD